MIKGILGRKVGMTQVYDEAGVAIPVTVIQAGPCHVLQVRTPDHDGYAAVQLGFADRPRRRAAQRPRPRDPIDQQAIQIPRGRRRDTGRQGQL